jgi:BirA family biotin operon repressor/biotin-[acetyl-CoA-carboxylase] ligase
MTRTAISPRFAINTLFNTTGHSCSVLDEGRVRRRLSTTTRAWVLELVDVIDSTNRVVTERAAAGAPEGLVVATDLQTAGRGRLDRKWETGAGDALLVSMLLRPQGLPPTAWHLVTAATGLAARQACQDVAGVTPALKWPNDLLIGDAKLAGILAEATGGAVVVGLGLNVHAAPAGAAWLDRAAGHRIDRSDLLGACLAHLDGWLGRWDDVAVAYREACATVGRRVVITQGDQHFEGWARAVDRDGRLVVEVDDGATVPLSAGDVTHVRTAV